MSCLEPQIYVACLAAYNNGHLHGAWIDAAQSEESLYTEIETMLKSSPIPNAEEWAIHDYEDLGNIRIGENPSLATISEMAYFIMEHEELGAEVLNYSAGDMEYATNLMEDCYQGEYDDKADFAQTITEEITDLPDYISNYIDYEKMAQDFIYSGDYFVIELKGKTHIFRNE